MKSHGSTWFTILCCTTAAAFALPRAHASSPHVALDVLCQDPAKQDPPKQDPAKQDPAKKDPVVDALLEAEREKLRAKDTVEWKTLKVKSLDEVLDPKKATAALEIAGITEDETKKMTDLFQKAKDGAGGAATNRALRQLEKMGWPALVFLVNQLRDINYKDTDDTMWASQINNTLSNITLGVNAGFVPPTLGEPMDPRMAQYNAMTVKVWLDSVKSQWPTREKFDDFLNHRKARKEAELEGREGPTRKDKEKK